MGYFERGLPNYWPLIFGTLGSPRTFIETGTFEGETSKAMNDLFDELHTIEASEKYFDISKENLKESKIKVHLGESPRILETLVRDLRDSFVVFFLDAHYSSGETYGDYLEQPLLKEISVILKYRNFNETLILIDDARLLNGHLGYPSLDEIFRIANLENTKYLIVDDILIIGSIETIKKIGNPNDFAMQLISDPLWN
jgi:predicted O-methyltransferase YrrM